MRRLGAALCALATLALGALPLAAHAADISKEARDRGMKEAPAVVQKAGVPCTVSDAYFIGDVSGGEQQAYEVACREGSGYVILSGAKGAKVYDCLATVGQSLACKLPANADPKQGLKPYIAAAGITCTPTNARWVGSNATTSVFEVACQEGPGYILQAPAPGAGAGARATTTVVPCNQLPSGGQISCTLTSKAQSDAVLANLVAKSGKACQISASRFMGTNPKNGDAYYEVGCGAQPGFVIAATKSGTLDRVVSCTEAKAIGGCTLTDAAKIEAGETADYTSKAKAAGFDCDVSKTREIGQDAQQDTVVELACSNRPDGMVGVFPTTPGRPTRLLDCVKAQQFGPSAACTLTSAAPIYAKYTTELAAKTHSTCQVSNVHFLARSSTDYFIETACSDGKPGFVLRLGPGDVLKEALSCGQAKASGITCTLPTNVH